MHSVTTTQDLLTLELKDLYSAESQMVKNLPKMADHAESESLKEAFEEHEKQTKNQIERLKEIAKILEVDIEGHECKGMKGLIEEGEEIMKHEMDPEIKDAALIGAAQKAEHYEIAGYGTARALAEQEGLTDIAKKLQKTLDEEGEADKKLTKIATEDIA
jgi:ferritin-like metal-binding protein YciE